MQVVDSSSEMIKIRKSRYNSSRDETFFSDPILHKNIKQRTPSAFTRLCFRHLTDASGLADGLFATYWYKHKE